MTDSIAEFKFNMWKKINKFNKSWNYLLCETMGSANFFVLICKKSFLMKGRSIVKKTKVVSDVNFVS